MYIFLLVLLVTGCNTDEKDAPALFEEMSPGYTGIEFANEITSSENLNIFNYRNFYNGGGVAIGDINNDGLPDIYFTANIGENKLYLNKGNFRFEDITEKAKVGGKGSWSTGAAFADVNSDGLLDLYVCNSGLESKGRANELFINKGNLLFEESAAVYGLDDHGYSTHASFFDYDHDGDLDMFLLNNSFIPVGRLGFANIRNQRDTDGGDKLFRNDGNTFKDVSAEAGIFGSLIGFGLGIVVGDVNNDNWPDIYVCNDFYEHDYLYINNRNGTFTESIKEATQHISMTAMGADIADLNNDGKLDIFVTDMLPAADRRLKLTTTFEGHNLMELKVSRDFHYQYMQNTFQLNQTDDADHKTWFSEIGRFAGTYASDWSWGPLILDLDADGEKDIFVANGINKDLTNQDFVQFFANPSNLAEISRTKKLDYKMLLDKMPSEPIANYAFRNNGNLTFTNKSEEWGLSNPSFSNGSAYGDLDNDGDLDLVVSNVNKEAFVYRNRSNEKKGFHYVKFKLDGENGNKYGIGTKVYVHQSKKTQMLQQTSSRGFQSSVDMQLVFGLGSNPVIDSVTVIWPDDKKQVLNNVNADSSYVLKQKGAGILWIASHKKIKTAFADVTASSGIDFVHKEADYVDYNTNPLIKQMYSRFGPALAVGDVNKDGLDDVYAGGATGQGGRLYLQKQDGNFADKTPEIFLKDITSEASDAMFFDANNDSNLDLLVVSGSNEFKADDINLQPKLYLNDGKGGFTKSNGFPDIKINASCISVADFDRDGDMDVFIGSRLISGQYGLNPESYLLVNDGKGNFKNKTKELITEGQHAGMITDATWADLDGDLFPELILVGDWMPVMIFKNNKGHLKLETDSKFKDTGGKTYKTHGWWNTVEVADMDNDGDMDIVLGNLGLNSRLKASQSMPVEMYVKDFDKNGVIKQIINSPDETGVLFPMIMKPDLLRAMPSLKKKFVKYEEYAGKTVQEIFDEDDLEGALIKKVYTSESAILRNESKGAAFTFLPLPSEAQFSPVYGIVPLDYDFDGNTDLMLAGNFFDVLPEISRYDASKGLILKNNKGILKVKGPSETGFWADGQIRTLKRLKQGQLILGRNNSTIQVFKPVNK
ncbi:VCBS repeat-containing protein [Dyadobacter sp. NIV53]|uniref:VCBS repeat-containing protein n=1 Tax=Dyadobacter sp. NIV53 TaxID=2861765 RepID=UPI001E587ADF|nr:VCBS repeat-containing protein [Dyadobacter sp. NIV53]